MPELQQLFDEMDVEGEDDNQHRVYHPYPFSSFCS